MHGYSVIMAKKKRIVKGRKKKKTQGMESSFKQLLLWACILLAIVFAVLYFYEYSYPDKKQKAAKESVVSAQTSKVSEAETSSVPKNKKNDDVTVIPLYAEIPALKSGKTEQIVKHEGYTVSFNPDYKIANWVAYELTVDEVKRNSTKRSDNFSVDPDVKGGTAQNSDYIRSGYDKGHLAPAGDMKWSGRAMRESFYFSNIAPQKPDLNRKIWKDLEERIREWALIDSALLIVTGPVIRNNLKRLGKSGVAIPDSFYKVIVCPYGESPKGIGFIFENKGYGKTPLRQLAIPIDSVESITGIDFFGLLPERMEQKVECSVQLSKWQFN